MVSILILVLKINAPPIQINIKSISLTASISPNNNPITSNLIDVKKPKITKPTANEACASRPSNASFGNFVFFVI